MCNDLHGCTKLNTESFNFVLIELERGGSPRWLTNQRRAWSK